MTETNLFGYAEAREDTHGVLRVMNKTFKALSALLTYPTEELKLAAGEMSEVLDADTLIPCRARDQLHALILELATGDLDDLQERYVLLFDPDAVAVAPSVRARARRKSRSRTGDDRSQVAIRAGWIVYERQRKLPDF